ncbi:TPA: AIR carboxylase family protein [archaeon]|uniref:N5-carboxyaminoimidazole ribonucleotide mutase n=1 Tax=Candidatus Naiadarchaeum limnaeum TaxID=2756139 RepID=A0A832V148_9ARCH|nr:AIR carboxylase family protein [Candidatus Naiadarchaeum limnaeum]
MAKKVCVIIASESDKDVGDKAIEVLGKFSIPYQYEQASAHREPKRVEQIILTTDAEVFICIAGLAGALPGYVAALTNKPVIGVPKNVKLMGLDALFSMVQMPSGIPVATVGIDNGKNAAYLAIRILGLKYPEVLAGEASGNPISYPSSSPLQTYNFEPPTSSPSPSSYAAFPLFSSEPSAPTPSYTPPQTTPPAQKMEQRNHIVGDWGVEVKKNERARGDWLQY